MANYSGARISECSVVDGATLQGHNFCQEAPGTPILCGVKGLTFVDCNLINCRPPEDATIIKCNTAQVDFCSHLHDHLSYQCEAECRHLLSREEIIVDGEIVDSLYVYADIVEG